MSLPVFLETLQQEVTGQEMLQNKGSRLQTKKPQEPFKLKNSNACNISYSALRVTSNF